MANIDNIDDAKTVRELEVNDTAYDIVGKGVLDQNNRTTNLEWIGTKAEYEALGAYSDKCTYIITDDSVDSQSDDVGAIAEDINTVKGDINTLKGYDYVVDWQVPTSVNGYIWYRKYKSGWVEQGGILPNTSGLVDYTVTLPVTMANNCYFTVPEGVWTRGDTLGNLVLSKTTTQIQFYFFSKEAGGYTTWEAKGMAA